jgi:phosphatidate cytidylyltransferase
MTFGLMAVFAGEMRTFRAAGQSIGNVAHAALASLYVVGLMGTLVQLRLAEAPSSIAGLNGQFALLALIATVKLSDICQYAVGRLFGRHKLAPLISPGKTWEGAVGGIVLATAIAATGIAWLTQGELGWRPAHWVLCWGYALSVALAGITGALAESLLKRAAGVKDSSDWLPGFGGVLDLLDSILFAAPIGYVWTVWGVISLARLPWQ